MYNFQGELSPIKVFPNENLIHKETGENNQFNRLNR
jgi:hypothetical protein